MKENTKKIIELAVVFILTIALMLGIANLISLLGENASSNLLLFISEGTIIVPAVIYIIIKKINVKEVFKFRKIRVSTFFLSILLGFLIMPIGSFVNVLTQFFVPNTMVQASTTLMEGSKLVMLLITGFFAPFVEEFVFRGLFHREFEKITTPVLSIIVSAVLFGVMHLNLNQMCYAIVLGLFFAYANNCSRSIYSSVIMHTVLNTINVIMLILASLAMELVGGDLAESTEQLRGNTGSIALIAGVYFVLGAIAFALTIPCFKAIKKIEAEKVEAEDVPTSEVVTGTED